MPSWIRPIRIWYSIAALLLVSIIATLVVAEWRARTQLPAKAEAAGQRVVANIHSGKIISVFQAVAPAPPTPAASSAEAPAQPSEDPGSVSAILTKTAPGKIPLSVVIGNLGLNHNATEKSLRLPAVITLGFTPYAFNLNDWIYKAHQLGHEVLIQIPMEPDNYPIDTAGPYALMTTEFDEENRKRFDWCLAQAESYEGIYSEKKEKFTQSMKHARPFLERVRERNLLYIYGAGDQNSAILQTAASLQLPLITQTLLIDENISPSQIEARLQEAENFARQKGYTVIIGNAYPITLQIIETWLQTVEKRGFQIVPATLLHKVLNSKSR